MCPRKTKEKWDGTDRKRGERATTPEEYRCAVNTNKAVFRSVGRSAVEEEGRQSLGESERGGCEQTPLRPLTPLETVALVC